MKKYDIGSRIRLLRGRESRPAFARRFGVSVATLARYESCETAPNARFITQLCAKYHRGTDWLLYGKNPPAPGQIQDNHGVEAGPGQAAHPGSGPEPTTGGPAPSDETRPPAEIKNEADNSNLTELINTLGCEDFDRLWLEFKSESEARPGWLQIEMIKRFPEFSEWLESLPPSSQAPLIDGLKK